MTPAPDRPPVVRIVRVTRRDAHGDRVEREVARREVGVDPVGERREVDRLVGVRRRTRQAP